MEQKLLWIITALGTATMGGAFWRMRGGFGPFNLRVIAIILVATLAALLAVIDTTTRSGAIGILGAIIGYVFGIKDRE